MKMKKFLSLIALLAFAITLSATGLHPPRDHTPAGYEIAISDADAVFVVADATFYDVVNITYLQTDYQPPGEICEQVIATEFIWIDFASYAIKQNSAILDIRDPLSVLHNDVGKRYNKTKFLIAYSPGVSNYMLFRCDRAMYV